MRGLFVLIGLAVAPGSACAAVPQWSTLPDLPTPRGYVSAAALGGSVYAVAGDGFTTVEAWDPATGTWAARAGLSSGRYAPAVAAVNGKLYSIGGWDMSTFGPGVTVQEYTPATNSWTTRASMPTARYGAGVAVIGGTIYVVSGYGMSGATPAVEAYDPAANFWWSRAPLPVPQEGVCAAAIGGTIYAVGGDFSNAVRAYDPATNTWTSRAAIPAGRYYATAGAVGGKLYVVGGNSGTNFMMTGGVDIYDPATNTWTGGTPMPTPRGYHGLAVLNGRLHAVGGYNDSYFPLDAHEAGSVATIAASLSCTPSPATIGQWISLVLTVTNAGSATVTGVIPSLEATAGGGLLAWIAGPLPAGPVSVAAGASQSFTWTYSVSGAGGVSFTATAAGVDGGTGAPAVGTAFRTVALNSPAQLAAAMAISPPSAPPGAWVTVTLSVTNVGTATANGVLPALWAVSGGALVGVLSGPVPPGPVTLAPGAAQAFAWTLSVNGAGLVALTATATGDDPVTGGPTVAAASGVLAAGTVLTWSPTGFWHQITDGTAPASRPFTSGDPLTWWYGQDATGNYANGLTNSGNLITGTVWLGADDELTFWSWEQTEGGCSWDTRWVAISTNGGGSWTNLRQLCNSENVWYRVTIGLSAYAGLPVRFRFRFDTIDSAANGFKGWYVDDARVGPRVLRGAAAAAPAPVVTGQWLTVSLTVTNAGAATVTGVLPGSWFTTGAGLVSYVGGPQPPGPVALAPGGATTFIWTYSVSGAGTIGLSLSVTGLDTGAALPVALTRTLTVAALQGARLASALSVVPPVVAPGRWFTVRLTVTNTGGVSATGVVGSLQTNAGGSLVEFQSGPVPPGPLTLAPGAATTFVWTWSASGAGTAWWTGTATGIAGVTGAAVSSGGANGSVTITVLTATVGVLPSPASPGQWVTVSLTVTNGGAGDVLGVLPALGFTTGSGLLTLIAGPTPPGPLTLAGGAATTFSWTYSVSGSGWVAMTVTAAGTDAGSGAPAVAAGSVGLWTGAPPPCPGPWGGIVTLAGTGTGGYNGDGIPATTATVNWPHAVAVDGAGNVYFSDFSNHRVRKVTAATGQITTIAGTGTGGYNGDGIAATSAWLNQPLGVTLDPQGNLYIVEFMGHRVRRISAATGLISTVAGTGTGGYNGDGIAATSAWLNNPYNLALDPAGNLIISDRGNSRIRKVTLATGVITTVAGTGVSGYNGDGIAATAAWLNWPTDAKTDAAGNLYIAEFNSQRVRRVAAGTGLISTIAGTGSAGYNGDGMSSTSAQLSNPYGLALDGAGNVYVADFNNHRIRRIAAAGGLISTVAGTGTPGYNGDGIPATSARLFNPAGLAVDATCRLYIAEREGHRVRRVDRASLAAAVSLSSSPALLGEWLTVSLTVTNVGSAVVTGVQPAVQITAGGGLLWFVGGPVPPGPLSLAPGAATVFTWTWSASGIGGVTLTATATGLDSGSGLAVLAGGTKTFPVAAPATLVAAASWTPAAPVAGQWLVFRMTVSNTGATAATGVLPAAQLNAGAGWLVPVAGPVPPGPLTITAGGATTFTWTWSVSGAGAVSLTVTAAGTAAVTGAPVQIALTRTLTLRAAAQLAAALAVGPASGPPGTSFTIWLTITNAGGVSATQVSPSFAVTGGGGSSVPVAGPVPPGPVSLAPGAAVTFAWTRSATAAGAILFTATAAGTDSVLLRTVAGSATGSFAAGTPAVLAAALSAPAAVAVGSTFTLALTVTNTGAGPATAVAPASPPSASPALAGVVAGPVPAGPVPLSPGASITFVWSCSASGAGAVQVTVTAAGTDAGSGAPLAAGAAVPVVIVDSAQQLTGRLVVVPGTVRAGESFQVQFTVSNAGGVAVANLAALLSGVDPALADLLSGPVPADGVTLAPGATVTFVWLVRIHRAGLVSLEVTATGDAFGVPVSVRAAAEVRASRKFTEPIVTFPNPVDGDRFSVSLGLEADAEEVEVEIFDLGLQRVFRGVWSAVTAFDGTVVVERASALPRGLYLLRARARLAGGRIQEFPAAKVVVR